MTPFGVQVVALPDATLVDQLFSEGQLPLEDMEFYPNTYIVLQSGQASALARVAPNGKQLLLIRQDERAGVKPRNKEQAMLLDTLLDSSIQVQVVTGKAGTGKTLLALAAAMEGIEERRYEKIILTRPMSEVGKYKLGALPGSYEEKIAPYLLNYTSNIEQLLKPAKQKGFHKEETENGFKGSMLEFVRNYKVEVVPLQLIRGASFKNAFIIADEVQVLDHHEMLTLGTRVAAGSKLVLMGDLAQRDEKISRERTGLHKLVNDSWVQRSPLTACIELQKVERGPVAELFTRVFEEAA